MTAALALGILVCGATGAHAGPGDVLSPRSTVLIRRLLQPHDLGAPLGQGWRLGDLSVTADRAVWHLLGPRHAGRPTRGALVLLAPSRERELHSAHFSIQFHGSIPLDIRLRLLSRIRHNDRQNPWKRQAKQEPPTQLGTRLPWRPTTILVVSLLALLLLTGLSVVPLVRLGRLGRSWWLVVAVLVLAGWVLRSPLGVFMPAHVNAHAYETHQELKQPVGDGYLAYGNGYRALFVVIHPSGEVSERFVYETNAVLGALSPAVLFLLVLLLARDPRPALAAAVILAILPAHVRLSASESRFVLAGLLALGGATLLVLAQRTRRTMPALAAALAWAVAVQVRPEVALLVLAIPLLVHAAEGRWPPLWPTLAGLLIFAVLCGEWLWLLAHHRTTSGAASDVSLARMLDLGAAVGLGTGQSPGAVWFDGRFTPGWLPLCAGVGLIVLGLRRRWTQCLALLALAWLGMATGLAFQHGANNLRLQLLAQPFWAALAGIGLAAVASFARAQHTRLLDGALLCLLAGATLWSHGPLATHAYTPQREYLFVKNTLPRLPGDCRIFYPTSRTKHPGRPPSYLSDESGRNHYWEPVALVRDRTLGTPGLCRLWYRPSACFTVNELPPGEVADGMQRGCREAEQRLRLRPLHTRRLPADPYHVERYGRKSLEIGFFEILARAPGTRP